MSQHDPNPRARREKLLVREMMASGETVVYDLANDTAHCLNRSVALVFRHCDGSSSVAEIARAVTMELDQAFGEEFVRLALEELGEASLLEEWTGPEAPAGVMSRRQALERLGKGALIAALVPLITTIIAPTPAAAGTCKPTGAGCTSGLECCSGFCNSGTCA